jgi:hypothetical protein
MNINEIIHWCITFICIVVGFWLGHQRGVLEGGKYVIHELMRNGSVTMIHTDGNTKMIWEINVPDEQIPKDE